MATKIKINKIDIGALNFDGVKTNLLASLANQTQLQDYNYEGSTISVITNVLAVNTMYNGAYLNFALNESFLDTASRRENVVSHAFQNGYVPRSYICSTATVSIHIDGANVDDTLRESAVTIPAYSTFISTLNGHSYNFYNTSTIIGSSNDGGLTFDIDDIVITEGTPVETTYTYTDGLKIVIYNKNVDTSTLKVRVQKDPSSSLYDVYAEVDSIVNKTASSNVYFLRETHDGFYEISFGNGVIGKKILDSSNIIISYMVSSGTTPNGCKFFTYSGATPLSGQIITVSTTSYATGGNTKEDIESVRVNAKRWYEAQDRAVTDSDYAVIISKYFSNAKSISAWGGQDNDPPVYGKTFVCVAPLTGDKLTSTEKNRIINTILRSRKVNTITPEIVDPESLSIILNITSYYDTTITTDTSAEIKAEIMAAMKEYNSDKLEALNGVFRYSEFLRKIDSCNSAIINSNVSVKLRRIINPQYSISYQYNIKLGNPVYKQNGGGSIVSSAFFLPNSDVVYYMRDDGIGNIVMYTMDSSGNRTITNSTLGTIDYSTGTIYINSLNIDAISGDDLYLSVVPSSYDVTSARNQLLNIDFSSSTITMVSDSISEGNGQGGAGFNPVATY